MTEHRPQFLSAQTRKLAGEQPIVRNEDNKAQSVIALKQCTYHREIRNRERQKQKNQQSAG
ncbi:MAG: hypothetical protein CL577_08550 [Alteromonadaceae bacterium]|nr:hypothetical protein [Alteromonadaceae bacterium]